MPPNILILFLRIIYSMSCINRLISVIILALLCSCKAYKQDIMFRFDDDFTEEDVTIIKEDVEKNYLLKPSDRLRLDVFTNDGERLIDPNFEIAQLIGGGQGGQVHAHQAHRQEQVQGDLAAGLDGAHAELDAAQIREIGERDKDQYSAEEGKHQQPGVAPGNILL